MREVIDEAQLDRLVFHVAGHFINGMSDPALERALEYRRNIDKETGDGIANGARAIDSPQFRPIYPT